MNSPESLTAPAGSTNLTSGVILDAYDASGHPLVAGDVEVFHAELAGVQVPVAELPLPAAGAVSISLPTPSAIPDAAGNYFAVVTGHNSDGQWSSGIHYFDLTAERPVARMDVKPNLFNPPAGGAAAGPTGPCGFDPDAVPPPPPPYFTITQQTDGYLPGTVDVGHAHGAGVFAYPMQPGALLGSSAKAVGEQLQSQWARATESSVEMHTSFTGSISVEGVTVITGNLHFSLATSEATDATRSAFTEQAGTGARGLVVSANWLHQQITFHCNYGDHTSETHDVYQPHQWDTSISTDTPAVSAANDSAAALSQQTGAIVYPLAANQHNALGGGVTEIYDNGGGLGVGSGPVGIGIDVHSQTTYANSHILNYWSGGGCGTTTQPLCYLWTSRDPQPVCAEYQLSCGSDYYGAVLPTPTTVPNPEPQPCSKFEPHGACD